MTNQYRELSLSFPEDDSDGWTGAKQTPALRLFRLPPETPSDLEAGRFEARRSVYTKLLQQPLCRVRLVQSRQAEGGLTVISISAVFGQILDQLAIILKFILSIAVD